MTFYNDDIDNLQVEISRDFKKVLLVNGSENFLLEDDEGTVEKDDVSVSQGAEPASARGGSRAGRIGKERVGMSSIRKMP